MRRAENPAAVSNETENKGYLPTSSGNILLNEYHL